MPAPQLSSLARRIAESDPANAHEQRQILWRLKDERDKLESAGAHADQAYLDAAITLISYVIEMGHIGGGEILEIAARVLSSMQPELEGEVAAADAAAARPANRPQTVKLKLREGEAPHLRLATERPPGWLRAKDVKGGPGSTAEDEPPALRPSGGQKGTSNILTRLIGDLLLGEVMIRRRYVTPEQVERALRIQRASGVRFGEALVQSGAATWSQVEQALRYQAQNKTKPADSMGAELSEQDDLPKGIPLNSNTSRASLPAVVDHLDVLSSVLLGQILVQNGIVTMYELQLGLRYQKKHGGRIGEALIAIGVATQRDINFGLRVQARMRRSV